MLVQANANSASNTLSINTAVENMAREINQKRQAATVPMVQPDEIASAMFSAENIADVKAQVTATDGKNRGVLKAAFLQVYKDDSGNIRDLSLLCAILHVPATRQRLQTMHALMFNESGEQRADWISAYNATATDDGTIRGNQSKGYMLLAKLRSTEVNRIKEAEAAELKAAKDKEAAELREAEAAEQKIILEAAQKRQEEIEAEKAEARQALEAKVSDQQGHIERIENSNRQLDALLQSARARIAELEKENGELKAALAEAKKTGRKETVKQ